VRIAIIGSGSVGCLYGARLARAGYDVRFLMRRDLDAVTRHGLTIHSCDGDFQLRVRAYGDPAQIGQVDWVICALKTTAIDDAERLIRPCLGPSTRILALMNGLGIEERLAEWFDPARILGGLAFVCINRGEPGVIHHTDHGRVAFGHLLGNQSEARQVADLFARAGFEVSVPPSLRQARWEKLMWNVPFNSLTITAGGVPTDLILADPGLTELARRLMREVAAAGNADGCAIEAEAMVTKMISNTSTMGGYRPSMLIDFENRQPLEVDAILGEPVRRAIRHGVPVPTMETQYHLTAFLDRRNRENVGMSG
jgi:2-dehydropantoate 2-reductase